MMLYLEGTTTTEGPTVKQQQISKQTRRTTTVEVDTRTPSGKPLPY